jgi:ubiquinone biosynthesis protein
MTEAPASERLMERLVGGPAGFRKLLIRLGPTYIKIGQYLALRPDLIPQAYCDELMVLFDRVPPFPWEQVRATIEQDLGADVKKLFAWIDPKPLAAGSIAQVHRARLHDGTEAAVKVRRPNVAEQIRRDLGRARILVHVLELAQVPLIISPRQVIDELTEWLSQEINLRHELANITLLTRLTADSPIQRIPKPYPDLSSERVLTTELLAGLPFSDFFSRRLETQNEHVLAAAGVDRNNLAASLITATLTQIFRYQFFHADLHPGNLFAMPGNVIGYVDFGLCLAWDGTMRWRLLRYMAAIYSADVERMYAAVIEILIPGEHTDVNAFREEFFAESRRWTSEMRTSLEARATQRDERSPIAQWMIGVMRAARRRDFRIPPMLVGIYRALLVAELVANRLHAEVDLRSVGRSFFERLQIDEALSAVQPRNLLPISIDYLSFARDAPGQTRQILAELSEGSFTLMIQAHEPPRVTRLQNRRARLVTTSVLTVSVAVLLVGLEQPQVFGISLVGPLVAVLLLLYASIALQWRRLR